MKVCYVAVNTFRSLVRTRAVLLVFLLFFLLIAVGSISALYFAAQLEQAGGAEQSRLIITHQLERQLRVYAVYAFIVCALAAAFALPTEIRTGTALPTLGRALPRSRFLLGLFLGVNLVLGAYLLLGIAVSAALFWWTGTGFGLHMLWGLLYVVLAGNIVAALTLFFSTHLSPLMSLICLVFFLQLPQLSGLVRLYSQVWGDRALAAISYLLPVWDLLDYSAHLSLTSAPAEFSGQLALVGVAHALDYVAVFLLLAMWVFRRKSLMPPS